MPSTQTAPPGQSGIATASEVDQFGKLFTITDPDQLQWSTSDPNITVGAVGDGTPTAKVTVGPNTQPGSYTVTFADPAAPSITVAAGTIVVPSTPPVATAGAVDLGAFA